jgi:serine/threonine protein kinase
MASMGLVHLDLKGSNVFLSDDNRCILGDFGIAYLEQDIPPASDGDSTIQAPETLNR